MLRRGAGPFDDLLDVTTIEALLTDLGRRPRSDSCATATLSQSPTTRFAHGSVGPTSMTSPTSTGSWSTWLAAPRWSCRGCSGSGHRSHGSASSSKLTSATPCRPTPTSAHRRLPGSADTPTTTTCSCCRSSGAKQWDIQGIGDVTLAAGDVVYLPAGTHHAARTAGSPSLHITLGHPDDDCARGASTGARRDRRPRARPATADRLHP